MRLNGKFRTRLRIGTGALAFAAIAGLMASGPALADRHHDDHRDRGHWHDHRGYHRPGYAYGYGAPGYVVAPPPVVYGPPPPPAGINFLFSFH